MLHGTTCVGPAQALRTWLGNHLPAVLTFGNSANPCCCRPALLADTGHLLMEEKAKVFAFLLLDSFSAVSAPK